jgi:hypothetical protein
MGAKEGGVLPPEGARVFTSFDVRLESDGLRCLAQGCDQHCNLGPQQFGPAAWACAALDSARA